MPIVLVAVFCFGKSKPNSKIENIKKTDEVTPDDKEQEAVSSNNDEPLTDEPDRTEEEIQSTPLNVDAEKSPTRKRKGASRKE